MKPYRPSKIEIKELSHGAFKIVDSENEDYQVATILEFNPTNSDLSIGMVREFSEWLVKHYNSMEDEV